MRSKVVYDIVLKNFEKYYELVSRGVNNVAQEIGANLDNIKIIEAYGAIKVEDRKFDYSYIPPRDEYQTNEIQKIAYAGKIYFMEKEKLSELGKIIMNFLIANLGLYPFMGENYIKSPCGIFGSEFIEDAYADYDRIKRDYMRLSEQLVKAEENNHLLSFFVRGLFTDVGVSSFLNLQHTLGINGAVKRALQITEAETKTRFPEFKMCTENIFEYAKLLSTEYILKNVRVVDYCNK